MSKQRQLARLNYFRNMGVHLHYVLDHLHGSSVGSGVTQNVHQAQMTLDFYAMTALRVDELFRQAKSKSRLDTDSLRNHFAQRWPALTKHRNSVIHILDPQNFGEVPQYMGGQFIANFEPGGGVKYVIDPRYHHEELIGLLVRFQELVDAELGSSNSVRPVID